MTLFHVLRILFFLFAFWFYNAENRHKGITHPENFKCVRKEKINKNLWKFLSKFHAGVIYTAIVGWKEDEYHPGFQTEITATVIPVVLLFLFYLHYTLLLIAICLLALLFLLYNNLKLCGNFIMYYTIVYMIGVIITDILIYFIDKRREQKKYD